MDVDDDGPDDAVPPTILATRAFPGILPSTSHHNVAWNDDGQCLFITKKGVNIVTPYLTTTLAPPPTLIDPSLSLENPSSIVHESRRKAALALAGEDDASDEEPLEEAMDDGLNGSEKKDKGKGKMRRPINGEIRFWSTGIEVDRDGKRNEIYGWNDVGGEYAYISTVITEKEATTRQAIWSPSGLSDLGGSLLVVLSSSMQVSVYAPRNDPYTKQWDEIADLTSITRTSLPSTSTQAGLSVANNLRMRTMCLQWSAHVPLPSMFGIDGSILALSNRAGGITFWSYGHEKRFRQIDAAQICDVGWVTDMAWSSWKVLDDKTCEAHLAMSLTDGSIRLVSVRRNAETDTSGQKVWELRIQDLWIIDKGDKRHISSVRWIEDVLIWTKSGTVHLYAPEENGTVQWNGIVNLRLERVGNWAGANALGPCVGINRANRETVVVTLSSLTTHMITDFTTSPTIAHPHDSLRTALAFRDIFEDHLQADPLITTRFRSVELKPEGWTANTSGWTSLGWGGVGTWVTEPMSFHTLDSATEGKRSMTLVLGNIGKAGPASDPPLIEALNEVLRNPPDLLRQSSGRILMPYLLHTLSLKDPQPIGEKLLSLLSPVPASQSESKGDAQTTLVDRLWCQKHLATLRFQSVLASWCEITFPSLSDRFRQTNTALMTSIIASLLQILLQWCSKNLATGKLGNLDRQFIDQIIKAAHQVSDDASHEMSKLIGEVSEKLGGVAARDAHQEETEERCPACKTEVGSTGVCAKGHAWCECLCNFIGTSVID
uniref:Transcription factor IIIC 90kDa subunit N-terminal domain-containing protein n=1 Tax=Kwoniella dejecticola CBS 10117 TaxID=1296121 RepID=A0A1A6A5D4_9TREE|nr:uncharacterized protein I303_04599 [Kwoniella dejecticola CBS 10117]OBR85266.1 hypothetical protein I303_04599 [Kwoniella dejecticola CBS 10117]